MKLKTLLKETNLWANRKFGDKLPTIQDYKDAYNKKNNIKESTSDEVYQKEGEIFDAINNFKQVFEKSEHKKHRNINKIIKDLYKLEAILSSQVNDVTK